MVTETRVHGASSFWQSIKSALPFGQQHQAPHVAAAAPLARPSLSKTSPPPPQATPAPQLARPSMGTYSPTEISNPQANVSDDAAPKPVEGTVFGYARNLDRHYRIVKELARGGNGIVTLVVNTTTGQEFAMKSLPKVLDAEADVSERKRMDHVEAIKREVEVLQRLRGCLNVASLEEVYEDDSRVHIIMEYCAGGELHHRIGAAHYSERTVASFMRATLRTLAQCHANKILHRDIKPGNFLLSSPDDQAPLKAVDFGLAVFFDDKQLPRTDLGLEGTPWFMAPEVLRSEVYPASDIWSAGIMCVQLLTGRFPFDDKSNPHNPSLSQVWKSILTDTINFSKPHWDGISDEAKDFVQALLDKDPSKRPTAKEALKHPWLKGRIEERSSGRQLSLAVVQRIQRYSQSSLFKRSVLELIAEELLTEQEKTNKDGGESVCKLGPDARPVITDPSASALEYLYERLRMTDRALIDRTALAEGLTEMGYKLTPSEVERLLDQLDSGKTGQVAKTQLAASQIDWGALQENQTERWLHLARQAFAGLDSDKDGVVSTEDMVCLLRHKLTPAEVEIAVRQALAEASKRRSSATKQGDENSVHGINGKDQSLRNGLNFRQFVRMLTVGSSDSLDLYDDRFGSPEKVPLAELATSPTSIDRVNLLLNRSIRGGEAYAHHTALDPVPEDDDSGISR